MLLFSLSSGGRGGQTVLNEIKKIMEENFKAKNGTNILKLSPVLNIYFPNFTINTSDALGTVTYIYINTVAF